MYCSLSGVTPKEPVVSRTGYIFERRLVEEHIQRLGTCPVTKEPLGENDLTDIKGPQAPPDGVFSSCRAGWALTPPPAVNRIVKPRTAVATSIPAMLQTFQNEWDSLMVETFELRKQLDQVGATPPCRVCGARSAIAHSNVDRRRDASARIDYFARFWSARPFALLTRARLCSCAPS